MKKYTKIIVEIPRGEVESGGGVDGFHNLKLRGAHFVGEESGVYDYGNWQIHELEKLAEGILTFCEEVKKSEIVPPVKRIRLVKN